MPTVFMSPVRPDLVRYVHTNMAKNHRQPYAVSTKAGHQTSAESWGTGRAVARIPRVPGGGTHRAGQGAFGNMCRGGRMFNPTKTWRRWHRSTNVTQKRHALVSAIAASGIPGLVSARGHRIENTPEMPLVLSDELQSMHKTKEAEKLLTQFGCQEELDKVADNKKLRAGKGKMRGRRYAQRKGPLVVYAEDHGVTKAFRNIPGVELCHVDRLNLLQMAPGGTMGRFTIWSASAFKRLQALYGNYRSGSQMKKEYVLPRAAMTNTDLARIINSSEIQSVLNPMKEPPRHRKQLKNPMKNRDLMTLLNPCAPGLLRRAHAEQTPVAADKPFNGCFDRNTLLRQKRKRDEEKKEHNKKSKQFYRDMMTPFEEKRKEVEAEAEAARAKARGLAAAAADAADSDDE